MNTMFRMLLILSLALSSLGFLESQALAGSVADAFKPVARFGTGPVNALAYSPDGKTLAVGGDAGVTLYDAQTLGCAGILLGTGYVTDLAWGPDGQLMVAYRLLDIEKSVVALWDTRGQKQTAVFTSAGRTVGGASLALSSDGQWAVAVVGSYPYQVWRWQIDKPESPLAINTRSLATAISTDNLLAYEEGGILKLWDLEEEREVGSLAQETVFGKMAFSPDGKFLATFTGEELWAQTGPGTLNLYDVPGRKLIKALRAEGGPMAFSPDGKLLAVGLTLWDTATLRQSAVLRVRYESMVSLSALAFSPNGTLATGFNGWELGTWWDEAAIRFWDTTSQKEVAKIVYDQLVRQVRFSPDGKLLVSDGIYIAQTRLGGLHVWDLTERTPRIPSGVSFLTPPSTLAFSPDGKLAVAVDSGVNLWDTSQQNWRMAATLGVESGKIGYLAFSPDTKLLAATVGGYGMNAILSPIVMWDVGRGQQAYKWADAVYTFGGGQYSFLNFSPDGITLAAVGYNESVVRLWSMSARREVGQLEHVNYAYSPMFSPDGKYLAVGSTDFLIHLWDVATKEEVAVMDGFTPGTGNNLTFTPDGQLLISADEDKIRLWDVSSRQEVGVLDLFVRLIHSLSISADGKYLAVVTSGGTILLWEIGAIPNPSTAVEDEEGVSLPNRLTLHQNYPNPFNPETTIRYELPVGGRVHMAIYDLLGHEIRTLVQGIQAAGYHTVVWDGRDAQGREVASGVYFYRLEVVEGSRNKFGMTAQTKRMVLLR